MIDNSNDSKAKKPTIEETISGKTASLETKKLIIKIENLERIHKIDPELFNKVQKMKTKLFPEISIFNQKTKKTEQINLALEQLKKLQKTGDEFSIKKILKDYKNFDNIVNKTVNENFLRKKHQNLLLQKQQLEILFKRMQEKETKLNFEKHINKNPALTKQDVMKEILANNTKLSKYVNQIEHIIYRKKKKTYWIFIVSISLILIALGFLIVYFIIAK